MNHASIQLTQEAYDKAKKDMEILIEKRKGAVINLRTAREMGDLSENGAYHAARFELTGIDREIRRLKILIRFGVVRQITKKGFIDFGSVVTLDDGKNKLTFTLLSGYESNPMEGKLSFSSPIGKAVVGKRVGDTAIVNAPAGTIIYKIISIE